MLLQLLVVNVGTVGAWIPWKGFELFELAGSGIRNYENSFHPAGMHILFERLLLYHCCINLYAHATATKL